MNNLLKIRSLIEKSEFFIYLIAAILLAIPLKNIFSSILIIVFVGTSLVFFRRKNLSFSAVQALPIAFYALMVISLFWSQNSQQSTYALQKLLPFLAIPICFLFIPKINRNQVYKIAKIFSYGIVVYALFYITTACIRYFQTKKIGVFFYHELVNKDLNVIYFSVLVSFALFYFVAIENKKNSEKAAIFILTTLLFMLSSKSIITIDVILLVCYYYYFVDIPKSTKNFTVFSVFVFLVLSVVYVKDARERFLLEYQTAFIDNTVNNTMGDKVNIVYNVSLQQAWNKERFEQNNFFPGTALRIYQLRIFLEMLQEQNILFTGFGLEASQAEIQKKAKEHNLFPSFGEYNFHNQYVQTFAEIGIIGFLLLLAMLYINYKNAWRNKDFLHIVFSVTMIMLFLSESFFCRQRGIVFFIFLFCLFNSFVEENRERQLQ